MHINAEQNHSIFQVSNIMILKQEQNSEFHIVDPRVSYYSTRLVKFSLVLSHVAITSLVSKVTLLTSGSTYRGNIKFHGDIQQLILIFGFSKFL